MKMLGVEFAPDDERVCRTCGLSDCTRQCNADKIEVLK